MNIDIKATLVSIATRLWYFIIGYNPNTMADQAEGMLDADSGE